MEEHLLNVLEALSLVPSTPKRGGGGEKRDDLP